MKLGNVCCYSCVQIGCHCHGSVKTITGGLLERGASQDFECDFKLDLESHSRKFFGEIIILPQEKSKMNK